MDIARVKGVALAKVELVYSSGQRRKKKAIMIMPAVAWSKSEVGIGLEVSPHKGNTV